MAAGVASTTAILAPAPPQPRPGDGNAAGSHQAGSTIQPRDPMPTPPPLPVRPAAALCRGAALLLSLALLDTTALRAQPAGEAEQAIRASYLCRGRLDALELTALFFNRDPAEVILLVGETATRLPRQLAASGSRYAAGSQEFWIKGDQASWRLGPHPAAVMRCQAREAQIQR